MSDLRELELAYASKIAMETCFSVKEGESVSIVVDTGTSKRLAKALFSSASNAGAEATLHVYPAPTNKARPQTIDPPKSILAAMRASDSFFSATSKSIDYSKGVWEVLRAGVKGMTCPGMTEDTFIRTTDIDYDQLAKEQSILSAEFEGTRNIRITSAAGTDISFPYSITYRISRARSGVKFLQLPGGMYGLATVDGTTNGTIVLERGDTLGWKGWDQQGILSDPIELSVKNNEITDVKGERDARRFKDYLDMCGPGMAYIAHSGFGLNPRAKQIGHPGEDERIRGAIYFGMGDNSAPGGGAHEGPGHIDGILMDANLFADEKPIIKEGRLLVL